jgi:hypothetical protein
MRIITVAEANDLISQGCGYEDAFWQKYGNGERFIIGTITMGLLLFDTKEVSDIQWNKAQRLLDDEKDTIKSLQKIEDAHRYTD